MISIFQAVKSHTSFTCWTNKEPQLEAGRAVLTWRMVGFTKAQGELLTSLRAIFILLLFSCRLKAALRPAARSAIPSRGDKISSQSKVQQHLLKYFPRHNTLKLTYLKNQALVDTGTCGTTTTTKKKMD